MTVCNLCDLEESETCGCCCHIHEREKRCCEVE